MSTPSFGRRHRVSQRSGFTLIEVAIALAIFVFGALAIVQIFPPALGVIRNNESRITATQLGENTLAQFKNKTTPPPEAVFDASFNAGTSKWDWQDAALSVVGTSSKNGSLPKTVSDFDTSALGHFRYIYGEPHLIGGGQKITLNYPQDTSITGSGTLQFFLDDVIEGVQINQNGYLDFANAHRALSPSTPFNEAAFTDPADATTRRPPNGNRRDANVTYYVSYRWRDAANPTVIQGVLDEPLSIPSDSVGYVTSSSARVLPCVLNSGSKVIPGGAQVTMRTTYTVSPSGTASKLGQPDRTINIIENTGTNPVMVYVNYYASDWRNLSDLDAPVDNVVQLPISGVEENSVFGVLTNSNKTLDPVLSASPYPTVDYKKGAVTYSFPATNGARVRTVYRTLDGWVSQPSVAPRSYISFNSRRLTDPAFVANFPREPWREYVWSSDDPDRSNIYFHASEAGKTVAVSYGVGNAATSTTLTIGNIEDAPTASWWTANYSGFASSGKVSRVTLTAPNGNSATGATSIFSVQGLSVQARTAWLNGDRYNQVLVPGYRNLLQ